MLVDAQFNPCLQGWQVVFSIPFVSTMMSNLTNKTLILGITRLFDGVTPGGIQIIMALFCWRLYPFAQAWPRQIFLFGLHNSRGCQDPDLKPVVRRELLAR